MIEAYGDLWMYEPPDGQQVDARVITTNGQIKSNGYAVMGKGVAYQAVQYFPLIDRMLGQRLKAHGNHVHVFNRSLYNAPYDLVTFPTKHDWRDNSSLDLIARSVVELVEYADEYHWRTVVLPRPGTGHGNLQWSEVKHIISGFLDGRFFVVTS